MIFLQFAEAISSASEIEKLGIVGILSLILIVFIYVWREDLTKRRESEEKRNKEIDRQNKERRDKEVEADIKIKIEKETFEENLKLQRLEFQKEERLRERKERELQRSELAQAVKENKLMQERVITMLSDLVTGNTQALQSLTTEINSHKNQNSLIMQTVCEEVERLANIYDELNSINKGIKEIKEAIK